MASFKLTVYDMVSRHPSIFPDLTAVYQHLFFTVGTGYDWVDGELVDEFADTTKAFKDRKEFPEHIREVRVNQTLDQIENYFDLFMDDNIQFNPSTMWFSKEYSHAFNAPKDIKDDWKDALWHALNSMNPILCGTVRTIHITDESVEELKEMICDLRDQHYPDPGGLRQEALKEILKSFEDRV